MGSIPPELSLDFRPSFVPKTISDFLKEVSMIGNVSEKVSRLDGFLKRLEEEMKKIDAFKRELPLCMLLLNDAILALKKESIYFTARNAPPVLEEFIPLKKQNCDEDEKQEDRAELAATKKERDCRDKKNWMSSVQLWNTDDYPSSPVNHRIFDRIQNHKVEIKRNEEENRFPSEYPLFQTSKNRSASRAFMPFNGGPSFPGRKEDKEELPVQGLSLLTPGIKNPMEESGSRSSCSRGISSSAPSSQSNFRSGPQPPQQQTARKQRRCWSPELHRRFVDALHQLGGSQVATPKQIRELMQVDGLTNDEVKSHLQKYRLHTRRLPSAKSTPANQSAVVLGGLWMSPDRYGESSKGSSSQSGSPQGPLQLTGNTGGTSTTGDESMEDDDSKSESFSWKGHIQKPGKDDV